MRKHPSKVEGDVMQVLDDQGHDHSLGVIVVFSEWSPANCNALVQNRAWCMMPLGVFMEGIIHLIIPKVLTHAGIPCQLGSGIRMPVDTGCGIRMHIDKQGQVALSPSA